MQLPRPLSCTSQPLTPQELPGLKGTSSSELRVLWGQPALGVTPTEGHSEEQWEAGAFLEGKSEHSHSFLQLTLNLRQKSRKQGGGKAMWASPGDTCLGEGGQALLPQCLHTGQLGALSWWWASWDSLPSQVAPASGLEANDDVSDL